MENSSLENQKPELQQCNVGRSDFSDWERDIDQCLICSHSIAECSCKRCPDCGDRIDEYGECSCESSWK
jgi:hypothetical protein